jgi:hypothetical protein
MLTTNLLRSATFASALLLSPILHAQEHAGLELSKGDKTVFLGDSLTHAGE